jgi:integrase
MYALQPETINGSVLTPSLAFLEGRGTRSVSIGVYLEVAGRGIIADLREDHVRQIRQKFLPSTSQADMAVIVLRILWAFAKEEMAMRLGPDPAGDIKRLHDEAKPYEPWPADVIAKFEEHVRAKPIARTALLLLLYTGQRVGDVAAMK